MKELLSQLAQIKAEYESVLTQMQGEAVMQDFELLQKLGKRQKRLQPTIDAYNRYLTVSANLEKARALAVGETDAEIVELAKAEVLECEQEAARLLGELDILTQPKDERDDGNVIMEIRPAAGGDEAALFGAALLRMYTMYAQMLGFRVEITHLNETEIGGVKEAALIIEGDGAFSKFKFESGVHRVQRIPETETQGRIHTSTCTVAVLPEATQVDFKIDEKDLRVDVYRSSGAGGQHVNRTESAVRITHLPTNMVVTCQDNRSQIKNRERAMIILQSKLADFYQDQADQKYAQTRKTQVGTGDRSERIRTYNFPQGRVTDHRIGKSIYNITAFMNGEVAEMTEALNKASLQN